MSISQNKTPTFGLIVGNRGFFPDHLAATGRKDMIAALGGRRSRCGYLDSRTIEVRRRRDSQRSPQMRRLCSSSIAIRSTASLSLLPNFGDERAIADTLRLAGLKVPVLVQATPDTPSKMTISDRRDSFCGKMSACNNLTAIWHSLFADFASHRNSPVRRVSKKIWRGSLGVCHVVRGLKGLRIGSIGARPQAFNTVRYSEKLLEKNGISIITIDLSEILGRIDRMKDDDPAA